MTCIQTDNPYSVQVHLKSWCAKRVLLTYLAQEEGGNGICPTLLSFIGTLALASLLSTDGFFISPRLNSPSMLQ